MAGPAQRSQVVLDTTGEPPAGLDIGLCLAEFRRSAYDEWRSFLVPLGERKYLIVDDSQTIRMALQRMLEVSGIRKEHIEAVEDGAAALKAFAKSRPEVVFVDIELPKMKGDELARKILKQEPRTRIVVVTGADRADPRVRLLVSQGAFEVLEKPIRLERVRTLLSLIESDDSGYSRLH